jgi:uncharacterized membrane-anchored protein YitT (DUF2179 family)
MIFLRALCVLCGEFSYNGRLKRNSMKKYLPTFFDYVLIFLSSLIQAVSLRIFFIPADLASGGVAFLNSLITSQIGPSA